MKVDCGRTFVDAGGKREEGPEGRRKKEEEEKEAK